MYCNYVCFVNSVVDGSFDKGMDQFDINFEYNWFYNV